MAPLKYPSAYGAEGGLASGHAYPPTTPGAAEAAAAALESPELKYSCSMDFMRGVSDGPACRGDRGTAAGGD